jgi:hypothetical protein
MSRKRIDREKLKRLLRGIPGDYALNHHSHVFEDRRTKRLRSRSEKNRQAIEEQKDE